MLVSLLFHVDIWTHAGSMGSNINVKEKWNPTLPKTQVPLTVLSMWSPYVRNVGGIAAHSTWSSSTGHCWYAGCARSRIVHRDFITSTFPTTKLITDHFEIPSSTWCTEPVVEGRGIFERYCENIRFSASTCTSDISLLTSTGVLQVAIRSLWKDKEKFTNSPSAPHTIYQIITNNQACEIFYIGLDQKFTNSPNAPHTIYHIITNHQPCEISDKSLDHTLWRKLKL